MGKEKVGLNNLSSVSDTLLIPLYNRWAENQRRNPLVRDIKGIELVNRLAVDASKPRWIGFDKIFILVRTREVERQVSKFLCQNPDTLFIEIGCGLDTRFWRITTNRAEWYEIDLPGVIAIRARLLPEDMRRHMIGSSVLEKKGWTAYLTARAYRT